METINSTMATEVKIGTEGSTKSLKQLENAIKSTTYAWKSQAASAKNAGQLLKSAEARYDGITKSISQTQAKIKILEERQKECDRTTKDGANAYEKYESKLIKARQSLEKLTNQQQQAAKALEYQKSGLGKLQQAYSSSKALSDSYVARLEAEGKKYEAAKECAKQYAGAVKNLDSQLQIQRNELDKIADTSGKTSQAYRSQQIRINETATKLAQANNRMKDLNESIQRSNPSVFDHFKQKLSSVNKEATETHRTLKDVFMGSFLGNALSNGLSNLSGKISNIYSEGMSLNAAAGSINAKFKAMGMSNKVIARLNSQIGMLKRNTAMSGTQIAQLQTQMTNWSAIGSKGAQKIVTTLGAIGDSSRLSGDQIAQMGSSLMRVGASGKVSLSSLNRLAKSAPSFYTTLAKGAGMSVDKMKELLASGKVTQKQFQTWLADASKYSDTAFQGWGKTQTGALKSMHDAWHTLEQTMTAPLFNAKSSGLQDIKTLLSSKELTNGAKAIGDAIQHGISFLVKHKKDISGIVKDIFSIGVEVGKDVWKTFSAIFESVAKSFGLINSNGKKSGSTLHDFKTVLDKVASNKKAIQEIANALIVIAGIKTLGKVGSGLMTVVGAVNKIRDKTSLANAGTDKESFLTGSMQSIRSARKTGGLSTAGKLMTGVAAAGVAADSLSTLYTAFKKDKKGSTKQFQDVGSGIGSAIGGGLGLYFGGPLGAAVGSQLGKALGGVAGKGAKSFQKGWKRNKPPKNFWSLENFGYSTHNFFKGIKSGLNDFGKWVKKNGKSIIGGALGLAFGGPLGALLGVKFGKTMIDTAHKGAKSFQKGWKKNKPPKKFWSLENFGYSTHNFFKGIKSGLNSFNKWWDKKWKSIKKGFSNTWKAIREAPGKAWKKINKSWDSFWSSFNKSFKGSWNKIKKFFGGLWDDIIKMPSKAWKKISKGFESFSKDFKKTWRNLGKGIQDIWDTAWGKIKRLAYDGVAGIVKVINTGIGGIDTVIAAFGGSKTAIKKIKFATGTGAFSGPRRAITKPTLAMLNDGNDSPETGNKEMIWRPATGQASIIQGRNTTAMLMPGDEVFNASETKSLMAFAGLEHFAKGTGVLSGIASWAEGIGSWIGQKASALMKWFKKATAIIANPAKALADVFKTSTKGLKGIMVDLGQGMMKSAKNAATSWWSTLWSMAGDKLGGSGSSSALLSAVEKYGSGKPYVWGATGPESFDCSGLVMYALKQAFGINYPHYSGSQYAASTHISKSQAKLGDLVFWGSGGSEHVGVYAGGNNYYSAQSPSQGIGMNTLSSVVGKGSPLFARVQGLKDDTSSEKKSSKGSSKLQSMIKDQVGSGFWKFMSKLGSLFGGGDSGSGGTFSPSMIRDAAKQMHVSVSDSFVQKLQTVIQNESGGRNIVQQIHDVNSGGNEARGILQYTPTTFAAYAVAGHKNIMNPYDQLLAFFNNSDWKNSIGWTTIWGTRKLDWLHSGPQGHRRYANGGLVATEQLAHVAEGNKPEMIIPLDIAKRSRANQLLTQVQAKFAAEAPQTATSGQATDSKELLTRMDKMLALLGMLLKGQGDMEVTLDGQKLGKVLKKQQTIENMRTALLYG